MTGSADATSTYCAMVRARIRPDGMTAPIWSGFSIHERRKRTSSSRRRGFFDARADNCKGISHPGGVNTGREAGLSYSQVHPTIGPVKQNGDYVVAREPMKTLILVKQPASLG